jgi:multidrug transporter EmrE-like cation transporter
MGFTLGVWIMLISGVLLNAGAQLLIKAGTTSLGSLASADGPVATLFRVAFQPFILLGLICYVVSVGLWIVVLSQVPVSVAYPMLSIGYIVNAFAAHYLFGEQLTVVKLVGIGIIILGVFILARSA